MNRSDYPDVAFPDVSDPCEYAREDRAPIRGREPVEGVRRNCKGFPISDAARQMVAQHRSWDKLKQTTRTTIAEGSPTYERCVKVVPGDADSPVEWSDAAEAYVPVNKEIVSYKLYTMESYMRELARTPGSIAKRALQFALGALPRRLGRDELQVLEGDRGRGARAAPSACPAPSPLCSGIRSSK